MNSLRLTTVVLALSAGVGPGARAQCSDAESLWTGTLASGVPSAPANNMGFASGGGSYSYIANGSVLRKFDNSRSGPGQKDVWAATLGGTIQNFPSPVPLSPGGEAVFIGADNGYVYRINSDGTIPWSRDLRRASCPAEDKIIATPTLQLYQYSNNAFKNAVDSSGTVGEDVLFVVTRYGCGTTTNNQVVAITAESNNVLWTFNEYGTELMDYGSDGCSIDYATNTLYCGTNQPSGHTQPTLWAISTTNGSLQWSIDAGSIRNRPQLKSGYLYIATHDGVLRKVDTADGSDVWIQAVTATSTITRNPWPEFRQGGYDNMILVVDVAGLLHGFVDLGTYGELAWPDPTFPSPVNTMPAVDPVLGKAWIGLRNGTVQQINLVDGIAEASATVGTGNVFDPVLDAAGGSTTVNRLTVAAATSGYQLRSYCLPWAAGWAGTASHRVAQGTTCNVPSDCNSLGTPPAKACWQWACQNKTRTCYKLAINEGKADCYDQFRCGEANQTYCRAGVCVVPASATAGCNSTHVGGRACGTKNRSFGDLGCADPFTDTRRCGGAALKNQCNALQTCFRGSCRRDITKTCGGAGVGAGKAELNAAATQLTGATNLVHSKAPANCTAFVSTARTGMDVMAGGVKVPPAGGNVTTHFLRETNNRDTNIWHGAEIFIDMAQTQWMFLNNLNVPPDTPAAGIYEVNVTAGGTPVLRWTPPAFTAASPNATEPYTATPLNSGPVGPVLDLTNAQPLMFVANWSSNGDIWVLQRTVQGGYTQAALTDLGGKPVVVPTSNMPVRVRALAWTTRKLTNQDTLYIAFSNYLYICNIVNRTQCSPGGIIDLNWPGGPLSDGYRPKPTSCNNPQVPATCEAKVATVLSMSADPFAGDVYMEVKNVNGRSELLIMREDDFSFRNLADLRTWSGDATPTYTYVNQGRLSARSEWRVIRLEPALNAPAVYENFIPLP